MRLPRREMRMSPTEVDNRWPEGGQERHNTYRQRKNIGRLGHSSEVAGHEQDHHHNQIIMHSSSLKSQTSPERRTHICMEEAYEGMCRCLTVLDCHQIS